MFSQVSYNVVIERFKAFADGHYLIKRFTHGQVDVTDIMKDAEYPWMHIVPVSMNPSTGSRSFSFDILFADLPRDKETKTEYQRESLSDCIRLAEDLLAEIQNGQVIFGEDVELESGATITPFMEEFTHVLTGVTLSLTMTFPWNWDACTIPADWSTGGSGSGGTGGGGASLLLKVNGVPNVVQTILDLVDGTGISINDLGDGRVELTNTGGGGGAVSWGAIVGTLSNQIDLQNALDLKVDISSLGAVAFSNDYNDLDNLPSIPASQVNSDWNAVSGVEEILNKPSLSAVATSGDYNDLSNLPTIPPAQIQSDWTQSDNTQVDYIKNKPTLPSTIGDMTKAVYDQDNDGIVDFAEALKTEVRNSTGATLRKGYIVYLSGSTGNLPNAVLGLASSDSTSAQTFGVVYEDIANNSNGYVVTLGQINTLDTRTTASHPFTNDTLVDGDVVYLSPTTAGYITNVKPVAPNHMVYVGMVVRTSPTNGTIQYRIQNGYELDELHDVVATSPANNDVLYYDGATSLWKTKGLTKSDVGLGNVDNTSDANKPISTATQTALNGKQDSLVSGTNIKTINSTSLLGSGDVSVQATLVSGTNIKTINSTSILGSGNISVPSQDSISLINNTAVTIGASTTSYVSFCAFTTNSVEASRQIIVPIAGTIKNLYVLTSTTQSAGGSQVCTLRKNGANTSLTTTIGASSVAGTFSDTTNSVSVSAGDKLSLQVQNNAASGTAAQIVSVAIIIERT
jgi:hypothetical protein